MPATTAELEYLFRHGVMRDAAYQLLLPSERHALHRSAALVLHDDATEDERFTIAQELVGHAELALEASEDPDLLKLQHDYLWRAARRCSLDHELERSAAYFARFLDHPSTTREEKLDATQEAASTLLSVGRGEEAERMLKQALSLCTDKDAKWIGRLHGGLAGVYMETGKLDEADKAFALAIKHHREQNDRRSLGIALTNRAIYFRHTGRGDDPRALLEEALQIHREVGNRLFEGRTLQTLGGIYRNIEENELSEEHYLRALKIFEEDGATLEIAQAWGNLANVYQVTHQFDRAEEAYRRALDFLQEVGMPRSIGIVRGNLSSLLWMTGRLGQAMREGRKSVEILERIQDRMLASAFRSSHARHLLQLGKIDEAERMLARSYEEAKDIPGSIAMLDYVLPGLFTLHLARACGVYGPRSDPSRRDPSSLEKAEGVLREMREAENKSRSDNTISLTQRLSKYMKQFIQCRNAMEKGEEAAVFNGDDISANSARSRRALLEYLKEIAPEQHERLKQTNATYFNKLREGTNEVPEPDWRSGDLPV